MAISDAIHAYERGDRSLLEPARAGATDPVERCAVEAALFLEGLHPFLPDPPASAADHPLLAATLRMLLRAAFLDLQHTDSPCARFAREHCGSADVSIRCGAKLGLLRLDAMRAEPDAARQLGELEAEAASHGLGAVVVEAAAARALAHLHSGRLDEARKHARRAARMARTEAIPESEYAATWVLARVRRHEGHAHLAIRILRSLFEHASTAWIRLIAWELALCGEGREVVAKTHCGPSEELVGLVDCARAGDRDGVSQSGAALAAAFASAPVLAAEAHAALTLLDSGAVPSDERLRRWCYGEVDDPPLEFACCGALAGQQGEDLIAAVVGRPGARARRVLAAGAIHPETFLQSERPGRTETAGAVLILAGDEGLSRDEFFQRVYGFSFDPAAHKSPLEVLVHRLRKLLEPSVTLDRSESGRLVASVHASFALPDPRCTRAVDDRLLRILAQQGGDSAKATASAAGVSVRTAQEALKRLVSDGSCQLVRHGRQLEYRIEDTTYSDPTSRGIRRQW